MWLLTLWTGLSATARRILIYALIACVASGAIYFAIRRATTKAWEQGAQAGRTAAAGEMAKDLEKQVAAERAEIAAERAALAADRVQVDKDRAQSQAAAAQLAQARAELAKNVGQQIGTIKTALEANNAAVASIPGSDLDDALRRRSAELAGGAGPEIKSPK